MAHRISIVRDSKTGKLVAEAAFSREAAWHNLGIVLKDVMDSKEAFKQSHLDWLVGHAPVINQFKPTEKTGYFHTYRMDNYTMLGCGLSDGYEPLQNHEAFDFMDKLNDMGMKYESAFALDGGKRIVLLALMPEVDIIADGDITKRYLLLTTSHDGSGSVVIMPTSVRVVCANTLAIALNEKTGKIKVKHTRNMQDRLVLARTAITACNHVFGDLLIKSQKLAQKKIDTQTFNAYLDLLLPVTPDAKQHAITRNDNIKADITQIYRLDETCNLDSIKETMWGAFNAVTLYADHFGAIRNTEGSNANETRFDSAMTGTIATRKTKALEIAVKMAGV